jgi:hypothetical protein
MQARGPLERTQQERTAHEKNNRDGGLARDQEMAEPCVPMGSRRPAAAIREGA